MKFSEIGYRGKFLQLPPQSRVNPDSGTIMLGTSYGDPNLVETIFDEWDREYLSSNQDLDVTSPFPKLTCLDGMANRIYTTVLYLNDFIYNQYNKEEYTEAFEFLILQKFNSRLYWAQIGWPMMFLNAGTQIRPLDSSIGFRSGTPDKAPNMPSNLMGIERSINFRIESVNLQPQEELFFIKANSIPTDFYQSLNRTNEELLKILYQGHPEQGAWLGRVEFK